MTPSSTRVLPAPLPPSPGAGAALRALREPATRRRVLAGALATSLAVHLAFSLWPVDLDAPPETPPLSVTLTEMPPPPKPVPVAAAPKPKPKRIAPRPVAPPMPVSEPEPPPIAIDEPAPVAADEPAIANAEPGIADAAPAAEPAPVAEAPAPATEVAAAPEPAVDEAPPVRLPPRVDLAYKVFLGTQGFWIGDATYRFEHTGSQYRIATVGQARGLAALLIRGQGRIESEGRITRTGLQPARFAIERGSSDRREVAAFDWESGFVTLHNQDRAALELPTYDPLALMWQAYFTPPTSDLQTFNIATTRRVMRYTVTREGTERIEWPQGEIDTERWHRKSDDGRTDGYVWLAPSLHYVPVKMRVVATNRGTIEALLDSIRVDEPVAVQ